jgi:hypothetical protein
MDWSLNCTIDHLIACARTHGQVLRHKTPRGQQDLAQWTACYTKAMNDTSFPYFHVQQVLCPLLHVSGLHEEDNCMHEEDNNKCEERTHARTHARMQAGRQACHVVL